MCVNGRMRYSRFHSCPPAVFALIRAVATTVEAVTHALRSARCTALETRIGCGPRSLVV